MDFSARFCRGEGSGWAAEDEIRLERTFPAVLGGLLGRMRPRTRRTSTTFPETDSGERTDGGVMAWAGTTPVLGALCRPKPAPVGFAALRGSFPPTSYTACASITTNSPKEAMMKFQIPKQQKPTKERIDVKLERS